MCMGGGGETKGEKGEMDGASLQVTMQNEWVKRNEMKAAVIAAAARITEREKMHDNSIFKMWD